MTLELFWIVALAVFATAVCIELYLGYRRGFAKSLINLAINVACIFIGIVISIALSGVLNEFLIDLLESLVFYHDLIRVLPNISTVVPLITRMLGSLLLFVPVFLVIKHILTPILTAVCRAFSGRESDDHTTEKYSSEDAPEYQKKSRRLGALVSIATAYLITVVMLTPFAGLIHTNELIAEFTDTEKKSESNSYSDEITMLALKYGGVDFVFDLVARTSYEGNVTYLSKEFNLVRNFDIEAITKTLTNIENLDSDDIANFNKVLDSVNDSIILRAMLADVLSEASGTWIRGETYRGVPRPSFGNKTVVDPFITQLLEICQTTNFNTVSADITTLFNISELLCGINNSLSSGNYTQLISELTSDGTVGLVENELKKNPRMAPLADIVYDMAIRTLIHEIRNEEKYSSYKYTTLLNSLADSVNSVRRLNKVVQKSTLKTHVERHLGTLGVSAPSSVTNLLAASLLNDLNSNEDASVDAIEELFNKFFAQKQP